MARTIEDQLEGGAASPASAGAAEKPTPDPARATVKELTEHCRATGRWPEGWTKLKAAAKRKAFEREFCPQATEAFDPSDPLHLIAEEVENADPQALAGMVSGADDAVGLDYFRMGGALMRVSEGLYQSEFGCDSFKGWLSTRTELAYGKARYLIRIYAKLVELSIPWPRVSGIGWTKLRLIVDVLDADNLEEWFEKAKALSQRELKAEVDAARGKSGGSEGGMGDGSGEATKKVTFTLHPDQVEVVDDALEQMMRECKTDSKAVALENVCASYLAGHLDEVKGGADGVRLAAKQKDLERARDEAEALKRQLEAAREEVEDLRAGGDPDVSVPKKFERAAEMLNAALAGLADTGSQEAAMEALVETLNARFPDVEVEVTLP